MGVLEVPDPVDVPDEDELLFELDLTTCQTPPKVARASPVAALFLWSMENVYRGWPLSVTWLKPLRFQIPSLPLIADAFESFFTEALLTVTGGQNPKQPLFCLHLG